MVTFGLTDSVLSTQHLALNPHALQPCQRHVAEEGEAAVPLDAGAPGVLRLQRAERLHLYASVVEPANSRLEAKLHRVDGGAVAAAALHLVVGDVVVHLDRYAVV